jgi:hypothetical protein
MAAGGAGVLISLSLSFSLSFVLVRVCLRVRCLSGLTACEMSRPCGLVLLTLLAGVAGLQTLRTAPIHRRCTLRMNAEAAVSEWCMSSGREDAAITILEGQDTAQVSRREE